MILALWGGTAGSKMVDGLAQVHGQEGLVVVGDTGDDAEFYGLRVCPDLDICTYVLAGVVAERGWGYRDDTFRCLEGLATYGRESWFGLGDRDLATHLHRTLRLAEGARLSEVTAEIATRLGVEARIIPMTDDPVRTRITTPAGARTFQEYLVDGGPPSRSSGSSSGRRRRPAGAGVVESIAEAERIVIVPSSPVVSIGTILAIPGVRGALAERREDCVAVSPIIGGPRSRARRTASWRRRLPECSATQMARIYGDVAGTFVLDSRDEAEAPEIAALGVRPVLTDVLMPDRPAARPARRDDARGAR